MDRDLTPDAMAQEAADALIGQCVISLEQWVEQSPHPEWIDSQDFLSAWDQLAFLCDGCGWYCSTDELNNDEGGEVCEDCSEEGRDDN